MCRRFKCRALEGFGHSGVRRSVCPICHTCEKPYACYQTVCTRIYSNSLTRQTTTQPANTSKLYGTSVDLFSVELHSDYYYEVIPLSRKRAEMSYTECASPRDEPAFLGEPHFLYVVFFPPVSSRFWGAESTSDECSQHYDEDNNKQDRFSKPIHLLFIKVTITSNFVFVKTYVLQNIGLDLQTYYALLVFVALKDLTPFMRCIERVLCIGAIHVIARKFGVIL